MAGLHRETTDDLADIYESGDEDDRDCLLSVQPSAETQLEGCMFMEPHPSPISEADSHEDKCPSLDNESCSESKPCSPINTARQHGELLVLSID